MARNFECDRGRRYGRQQGSVVQDLMRRTGPAHAVYFATYEAVKQAMGGNQGEGHHPLAAGMSLRWHRLKTAY